MKKKKKLNKEKSEFVFPDIDSKEWKLFAKNVKKVYDDFKSVCNEAKELYTDMNIHDIKQLGGKRQPKIVHKLFRWPGDITPPMLVSLIKDVEKFAKK